MYDYIYDICTIICTIEFAKKKGSFYFLAESCVTCNNLLIKNSSEFQKI